MFEHLSHFLSDIKDEMMWASIDKTQETLDDMYDSFVGILLGKDE